jgi:hypothetical protein
MALVIGAAMHPLGRSGRAAYYLLNEPESGKSIAEV